MALSMAATEFGAALTTLGIKQRSAARWFRTSERNIRRWKDGTRKTPPGVAVVVQLILAGKVTVVDVELAAGLIPTRTNGAKPEPLAPLVEATPAPEQPASVRAEVATFADLSPAAAAILALSPEGCRWPLNGSPQDRGFRFCNDPVSKPPYCPRHALQAHLALRPGRGHGVRGFVVHERHGRPPIPGAPGASRPPKLPFDCAGDLPSSAPPPA